MYTLLLLQLLPSFACFFNFIKVLLTKTIQNLMPFVYTFLVFLWNLKNCKHAKCVEKRIKMLNCSGMYKIKDKGKDVYFELRRKHCLSYNHIQYIDFDFDYVLKFDERILLFL